MITAGGVTNSDKGKVIIIMHQYAYNPVGRTVHSSIQIEAFKNLVEDKPSIVTGKGQYIDTLDGYRIPLKMLDGLPYMDLQPST